VANPLNQVGGPAIAPPGANRQQAKVPFRRATTGRTQILQTSAGTNVGTPTNSFDVNLEGSGFIYGIDLDFAVTCAANAAAVAYFEDAPWSTYTSIVLRDVNGELINLPGFSLRVANVYGGAWLGLARGWNNFTAPPVLATNVLTPDVTVANLSAAVGPGDGGTYRFHLEVPCALNRRNLWGLLGNQDRAQKYSLRTDIASAAAAAAGPIYTTAPTTQGTYVLRRVYENYAVPGPVDANGHAQEQLPPQHGILNFLGQSVNPSAPTPGTVNHYLPRLGNTIRSLMLIYRSGAVATGRVNAEALLPTQIQFNLGDTPIWVETAGYRRNLMEKRFGTPAFQGVFAYDCLTDFFGEIAGGELGDDYLWTSGLVNAQFQNTYPAGVATASLTVVTADSLVPPNVDIYA
jgi:hypothetical protein